MTRPLLTWLAILVAAGMCAGTVLSTRAVPRDADRVTPTELPAVTRQVRDDDCGIAAVSTLARMTGVEPPPYRELLARFPPGRGGASVADLVAVGRAIGLRLAPARVRAGAWPGLTLPVIAHMRRGHFVVLASRGSTEWVVADPARGVRRMTPFQLDQAASGAVLIPRSH